MWPARPGMKSSKGGYNKWPVWKYDGSFGARPPEMDWLKAKYYVISHLS
jgi:hypothetical protein